MMIGCKRLNVIQSQKTQYRERKGENKGTNNGNRTK